MPKFSDMRGVGIDICQRAVLRAIFPDFLADRAHALPHGGVGQVMVNRRLDKSSQFRELAEWSATLP